MPLKDDKETENTVVKNEEIHENDVLMGRGKQVVTVKYCHCFVEKTKLTE